MPYPHSAPMYFLKHFTRARPRAQVVAIAIERVQFAAPAHHVA
jgi:hypothetical protein